ncbi:MAG TPA: hypothetical protein VMW72_08025 [Sedimentisphaerales bacterium]|nr:hypothetical protein [Sedimentisphaerales bacterium]
MGRRGFGICRWPSKIGLSSEASETLQGGKPEVVGHSGSDGTIGWAWPELDLMA